MRKILFCNNKYINVHINASVSEISINSEITNCCISPIRDFITFCKENLSVKRHLAVTNVSSHWYIFIHTMEHDQIILTH